MIFDPSKETRPEVLAAEEEYFSCKPCFEKGRNRHIFQSGFNAGAASRDAEVARLKSVPMKYRRMAFNAQLQDENAQLREQVALLREALKDICSDYEDRFDIGSPSTNPGMKFVVKQAQEALDVTEPK